MPRYKQSTLSEDEWRAINRVIGEEKRAKVGRRATALRRLHEGHAPAGVAEVGQVSEATVYNWHRRWIEEGIGGLVPHAPPGRRVRAAARYWQAIETALERDPEARGYWFTIWTVERLRDHVEQVTGVQLSVGYLGEQMKARGYVYRRPKQDLRVHQDPAARAEAEARLDELKKKAEQGDFVLLFVDESTVNLQTPLRKCWMRRGQQRRLPVARGPQAFQPVIGALDWATDQVCHQIVSVKNSHTFIGFLEHLWLDC